MRATLSNAVAGFSSVHMLVASGGTLTTLAEMVRLAGREEADRKAKWDSEWTVWMHDVEVVLKRLRSTALDRRHEIPGLPRDRVEIIVPGLLVVRELMERLKVESVVVNPAGIREGLLLRAIEEARKSP